MFGSCEMCKYVTAIKKIIMSTKLIGLDTSSNCSGWAIFIDGEFCSSGAINCKKEKNSDIRLQQMCLELLSFLNKEKPDIVAIEMPVVTRNAQAQRTLTMITGVVYGWCIQNQSIYESLRPAEWRSLISKEKKGRKRDELKIWSINKVNELFGVTLSQDDESDAILVAQAIINKFDK